MAHQLPSARHLADLHGFYRVARLNSDGTADITFRVPPDMKEALLSISTNDGMALNISIWETTLPEGDDWLASALGLSVATPSIPKAVEKVPRGSEG